MVVIEPPEAAIGGCASSLPTGHGADSRMASNLPLRAPYIDYRNARSKCVVTELNARWQPLNRSQRGNREFDGRTMPHLRFHPNATAMAFHYLPAKCKPNACAGNFLAV